MSNAWHVVGTWLVNTCNHLREISYIPRMKGLNRPLGKKDVENQLTYYSDYMKKIVFFFQR